VNRFGCALVTPSTARLPTDRAKPGRQTVQPWVVRNPFRGWTYGVTTVQNAANRIGIIDITIGVLLAIRPWWRRVSVLGRDLARGRFTPRNRAEALMQAAMENIERAVARNLLDFVEAARQVAPNLGVGATSCGGGVGAVLGADSPLTTVKGAGPSVGVRDVDAAETFFRAHGVARVVFELAPWANAETIDLLVDRGYQVVGSEDVVARQTPFEDEIPVHRVVSVSVADWPPLMLRMNEASDSAFWVSIVDVCAVLPDALRVAGAR
jgi:hypothetical protein